MAAYLDPSTSVSYEQPYADLMRRGYLESAFGLAKTPTPIPVRQYAGLDPMQLFARQLAGGLGGFAPFIQQGGQMLQEGLGVTRQGQGALAGAQDLYGQGTGLVGQGAGLYGLGTQMTGQAADYFRPGAASAFYNPYEDSVVQQTLRDLQEADAKRSIANRTSAVSSGAFGGSRGRIMEQERERAFGRGAAEAIGDIRRKGFEGARGAAMTAGQGLGTLGGQLGTFGSGLGALGGRLGTFGSGLTNVAGQYGSLGRGIGNLGTSFANLGTTGQSNLLRQINAMEGLGATAQGIQDKMYGAEFDAATRLAAEPQKRLDNLRAALGLLPTTRATTRFGTQPSDKDAFGILNLLGIL
jgi:hypothetical protein